jgi:hypothetical protein
MQVSLLTLVDSDCAKVGNEGEAQCRSKQKKRGMNELFQPLFHSLFEKHSVTAYDHPLFSFIVKRAVEREEERGQASDEGVALFLFFLPSRLTTIQSSSCVTCKAVHREKRVKC